MSKLIRVKNDAKRILSASGLSAADGYRNAFGAKRGNYHNMMGGKDYGYAQGAPAFTPSKMAVGKINDVAKANFSITRLSAKIVNDDASDLFVSLFGGFFQDPGTGIGRDPFDGGVDLAGTAAGSGTGLTVTFAERVHAYIQELHKSQQAYIVGMRISVPKGSEAQLDNEIKGVDQSPNSEANVTLTPTDYITEANFNTNIITIPDFEFLSDGNRALQFKVNAGVTVKIFFEVAVVNSPGEEVAGGASKLVNERPSLIYR